MRLRPAALLCALALAAVPALAQVNLVRLSPVGPCPGGCGPGRVLHDVIPGAVSQGGTGPGADLHLEFPLFNRALPNRAQAQATLVYDSLFWQVVNGQWEPAPGAGWWLRSSGGRLIETEQQDDNSCGWSDGDGDDGSGSVYYFNFTLDEPDGSSYFVGTATGSTPPDGPPQDGYYWDCPTTDTLPETFTPYDGGKGFSVVVTGNYSYMTGTAYDRYGDNVTDGLTDLNGNALTISSSGIADPLGTAIGISGSGTPSSPIVYAYPGPGDVYQSITVNYASEYVQGDFGCYTGYAGYINLPSSIVYPDGSTYTLGYDSAGRISSLKLPSGGTINYSHSLTVANCTYGYIDTSLTQTDPDNGVWQWAYTASPNQTVQTDPYGNTTVFDFDSYGNPTEEDDWQGNTNGGTELRSTITSIVGYATTWTTEVFGSPNLYRQTTQTLDADGFVTDATASDWYQSGTPPLLTQQINTYGASGNGEVLTSAVTEDGGGNTAAETTYGSFVNGNPKTVSQYVSAGTSLSTDYTYNSNGTVATETEPNGAVTTFGSYACGSGFFPGTVTNSIGTVSLSWDCDGALPTGVKDYNSQATSITYDDRWRESTLTTPDSAVTTYSYTSNSTESAMPFNYSNGSPLSTDDVLTTLDSMGRPILRQTRQAPGLGSFDTVETCYDEMSRPVLVTEPYSGTAGQTESCSSSGTSTQYDALSRPTTVTNADGGYVSYTYNGGADVLTTVGPAPSNENLKEKQEQFDGLDRLESVCEITSGTSVWPGGNCGQLAAATGYLTAYSRNGLGAITGVTQNAQSSPTEPRNFSYDWLGRLTSEASRESGTTSYTFDTDSTCGTSEGDLVRRADANGNVTCYSYDPLHRVTEISYTPGSGVAPTPNKYFVYDAATVDGAGMADAAGKLAEAYTADAATPNTHIPDLGFGYSNGGDVATVYQDSPNSGGWYESSETFYGAGREATITVPGMPNTEIAYGLDGEGRPNAASITPGVLLDGPVSFNTAGQPTSVQYPSGAGTSDSYIYDAATGRMKQYQFTLGSQTDTGTLTWNPNGSAASLTITDNIAGTADSQICGYTHDDLGRLASVNCTQNGTQIWQQTFTLDPFGNVSKSAGTGQSFSANFNLDNRISSGTNYTPQYDSDGNLTDDPVNGNSNAFDADGHAVTFEGVSVDYDAFGRVVQADGLDGLVEFVYSPAGRKIAVMNGSSLVRADVPLPGGAEASFGASGLTYYAHADWLGSSRLQTKPDGSLWWADAIAPYGEAYNADAAQYFTGMQQDVATNNYDFLQREYNTIQGRWWTPDPAGLAAVDPSNPQS